MSKLIFSLLALILLGAGCSSDAEKQTNDVTSEGKPIAKTGIEEPEEKIIDFSAIGGVYAFKAAVPEALAAEYVARIDSVNIYDPALPGNDNLEKSRIFIRNFRASDFLTLTTVDILEREKTSVSDRQAVRYRIKKKPGVANFPNQPGWRSQEHDLIDIRLDQNNPSYFYVIARNPALAKEEFEDFISSLRFKGDPDF